MCDKSGAALRHHLFIIAGRTQRGIGAVNSKVLMTCFHHSADAAALSAIVDYFENHTLPALDYPLSRAYIVRDRDFV